VSLETDLLVDRVRLKRHLAGWRIVAVLALLGCALVAGGRFAGPLPGAHVARLRVAGIIGDDQKLAERVAALAGDRSVKALIVDIDSPGGSVAGGEGLHDAIEAVAARKPVVAVMGGVAASAGYMIAVPAARIFAREATLTGSIGVILQTGEISGLLQKLGITADAIVSGPLKDQPSFTQPLSGPGRQVLHGLVMDLYDQFVGMVAAGRHMTPDQVRALADGRAYTGRQALKLGLLDQIGDTAAARAWLAANRGVGAGLPVRDLDRKTFMERSVGASLRDVLLGDVLGLDVKSVFPQGLALDGAWAVWQPALTGQ
jgi:protease-4